MNKKNAAGISEYFRWKNTPAGPALDASLGDLVVEKLLEKADNKKAKEAFDVLRDVQTFIDDNIIAH